MAQNVTISGLTITEVGSTIPASSSGEFTIWYDHYALQSDITVKAYVDGVLDDGSVVTITEGLTAQPNNLNGTNGVLPAGTDNTFWWTHPWFITIDANGTASNRVIKIVATNKYKYETTLLEVTQLG